MINYVIAFIIGLIIGNITGVFLMCIVMVGSDK